MNVPKKHIAIAHAWVDGAEIEGRNLIATYGVLNEWGIVIRPTWEADWEYRIALTKPSINWEHVAPEYVALATDKSGSSYIFRRIPEATDKEWKSGYPWTGAEVFQSFVKGTCDWKDSLVIRPSADLGEQQ
jgi:hypothetical protein